MQVSNVGQTRSGSLGLDTHEGAQAFTTGDNSDGYTVTSVGLDLSLGADHTINFTVGIWTNSNSNLPGSSLGTLTQPASLTLGVNEFTTSGITLAANTTYWVVVDSNGGGSAQWEGTAADSEDSTASGWSIANESYDRPYGDGYGHERHTDLHPGRDGCRRLRHRPVQRPAPDQRRAQLRDERQLCGDGFGLRRQRRRGQHRRDHQRHGCGRAQLRAGLHRGTQHHAERRREHGIGPEHRCPRHGDGYRHDRHANLHPGRDGRRRLRHRRVQRPAPDQRRARLRNEIQLCGDGFGLRRQRRRGQHQRDHQRHGGPGGAGGALQRDRRGGLDEQHELVEQRGPLGMAQGRNGRGRPRHGSASRREWVERGNPGGAGELDQPPGAVPLHKHVERGDPGRAGELDQPPEPVSLRE